LKTYKAKNVCVQDARQCASHHGPWWAPRSAHGGLCTVRSRSFLNAAFWCTFWASGFALDLPVLGLLSLLFNLSSLGLASTDLVHLKLGPNHANLQSQLNKAKTERNRRKTCINRKLMQINPKFQAYIIKNTHAYLHLSPCYPSHP